MDFVISDTPVVLGNRTTQPFDWTSVIRYTMIIIVLAFLGINLFTILGKTALVAGNTAKQTINVSAKGTNSIVDVASGVANNSINVASDLVENGANILQNKPQENIYTELKNINVVEPEPIENNRSGYCYIGKDDGLRVCTSVSDTDKCMSGDVFPSLDICVNPALR